MAFGGEVGGTLSDNIGSEDLDDVKCQPCQDDGEILEAVGMCTDCQEYLCQRCFDGHKLPRPSRNHQLLNKQEMVESQIRLTRKDKCTVRCPKHSDKNVKYYCAAHCELSCSVCLNLDHRACNGVLYIPDVADDLENNAEYKQADDHLSTLLARFRKAAETAKKNSEGLDSTYSEALEMIRDFRNEINDAIDKIERKIIEKASGMKSSEMEEMLRTDEERTRADKLLQVTAKKIETFRKMKQNCNLFTEMMKVKTKLDSLDDELKTIENGQSRKTPGIQFTPNMQTLDLLKQTDAFGKLTVSGKREHVIVKAAYSHDINVECAGDKSNCWISGSVILPDNILLVTDRFNSKIKAVDVKQGTVSSHLTLSSRPRDIAVINNDQVAVTLPEEEKVDFIRTAGKLAVDRSLQVGGSCHGIDYRDGKLAISFESPHQIEILDLQGTVLHTIKPLKQDVPLFYRPFYTSFAVDSTTLYVSNFGSNEIVYTKLDGTVVGSYTDSDLESPRGMMLDRCGNVYVCSSGSHPLHQLTPDCKKIRVLLTGKDDLCEPHTVTYSESENKLYVGMDNDNSVKVYKVTLGRD